MKVYIHPTMNPLYSGFYVEALMQMFGKNNVCFSTRPFYKLHSDAHEVQLLYIIVDEDGEMTKFAIDANDFHSVKSGVYEWCDVYGHCNANFSQTPTNQQAKLVSICPSFGIKPDMPFFCFVTQAICNALMVRPSNIKNFLGKYKRTWTTCLPISSYQHSMPRLDYVFFCSTLWYNDEWNRNDETLNLTRAHFIRACRRVKALRFEGGLVSQGPNRSSEQLFQDCLCPSYSKKDWLKKTKQSAIVFNTPAFWGCHGWKLGEYLALGKCIISTKLQNDLPHPLEHGKNIHFVENSEDAMVEAIEYILAHPEYRQQLEQGALNYWKKYGCQAATMSLLLNKTSM